MNRARIPAACRFRCLLARFDSLMTIEIQSFSIYALACAKGIQSRRTIRHPLELLGLIMDTTEVAKISKALADPTRLQIYEEIATHPDIYCGEIIEKYELSPGTVSHHLKILLEAGLIDCRKDGQFVHNRALSETMREYTQALNRLSRGK
jgi:ArsR family transcriptional regulator